jgi:O-antigen/teichoic acid export membrane protein
MKQNFLKKFGFPIFNNSLFRSTGVYISSSFLNALVPFLMMPVLTRYLEPVDYGIVAMFTVMVRFVTPFTGLSMHGAVYRQYFELERKQMNIYVTNILLVLFSSSFIIGLIFWVFSGTLVTLTAIPGRWLGVVVLVSMTEFISQIRLSLWQVQVKPFCYGFFQNLKTVSNVGLSLFFVLIIGLSWRGRLWGIILSSIIFACISLFLFWKQRWLDFHLNSKYIKNALNFGIPMIPTAIKGAIMTTIDRLFITNMIDVGVTGLYTVGYQLSMAIHLLTASFNNAYVPWLFKRLKLDDINTKKKIVTFTYVYFASILTIALIWVFLAYLLLDFFVSPQYSGAKPFIFWLSMGFAFSGMHSMVVNYIYFAQKTARYGLISIVSVLLNIGLNFILILKNGAVGAAQATCITFFLTFLMTWWLSCKVHPMPWFFFLKGAGKR